VGLGWIVIVPRQVPARNDCCPVGPVGPDDPSPQPVRVSRNSNAMLLLRSCRFMV
jgi:hypothetical protein